MTNYVFIDKYSQMTVPMIQAGRVELVKCKYFVCSLYQAYVNVIYNSKEFVY